MQCRIFIPWRVVYLHLLPVLSQESRVSGLETRQMTLYLLIYDWPTRKIINSFELCQILIRWSLKAAEM